MLCEMQKCEKDMLLLGKLQVISKAQDDTHHARQTTAGKRKCVTCEYAFDRRPVCRDGFLFLHNLGSKQLKNLQHHLKLNGPVNMDYLDMFQQLLTLLMLSVMLHNSLKILQRLMGFHTQQLVAEGQKIPLFIYRLRSITK